jgi:hypothetical protein
MRYFYGAVLFIVVVAVVFASLVFLQSVLAVGMIVGTRSRKAIAEFFSGASPENGNSACARCYALMANTPPDTWYVAFELPRVAKRSRARNTETFPNEREAKQFARAKLIQTLKITAGTLNPYSPKRTVTPENMPDWIEEPDESGAHR